MMQSLGGDKLFQSAGALPRPRFWRFALATVFLTAASQKVVSWMTGHLVAGTIFGDLVQTHAPVAAAVVGVELFLGIFLAFGVAGAMTWLTAIAVLSGFAGVLILELTSSSPRNCGCMDLRILANETLGAQSKLAASLGLNILLIGGATSCFLRLSGSRRVTDDA